MRVSKKKASALFTAIYDEVITLRIDMKLPPENDYKVAQLIHKIWKRQAGILGVEP